MGPLALPVMITLLLIATPLATATLTVERFGPKDIHYAATLLENGTVSWMGYPGATWRQGRWSAQLRAISFAVIAARATSAGMDGPSAPLPQPWYVSVSLGGKVVRIAEGASAPWLEFVAFVEQTMNNALWTFPDGSFLNEEWSEIDIITNEWSMSVNYFNDGMLCTCCFCVNYLLIM
jgi:hypothetical protein